jgi:hypothetical protein
MVTVQIANNVVFAEGFGQTLLKKLQSAEEAQKWEKKMPSRLITERLKGFVLQRRYAYQKKQYFDHAKWKALNDLHYYIDQTWSAAPATIFKMVVAHQSKWMLIMPHGDNSMKDDMKRIISYCEEQLTLKPQNNEVV